MTPAIAATLAAGAAPDPQEPALTRTIRTPRARAEDALAVAQRRVTRLEKERAKHERELERVTTELDDAVRRRDYAAADPALPEQPTQPTADTDTDGDPMT